MKKLLTIMCVFLVCTFVQAQVKDPATLEEELNVYGGVIFDDMTEKTGGYLTGSPELDRGNWHISATLAVASYYSFDLVRMDVRNFVNSYSDVSTIITWRAAEDERVEAYNYAARFMDDYLIIFIYSEDHKRLAMRLQYSP